MAFINDLKREVCPCKLSPCASRMQVTSRPPGRWSSRMEGTGGSNTHLEWVGVRGRLLRMSSRYTSWANVYSSQSRPQ